MYLYCFVFEISYAFLCGFILSVITFCLYGQLVDFNFLLKNDYPRLWWLLTVSFWILKSALAGYFGNAVYYQSVKKKIRKGYHLLEEYLPTSIPSFLSWPLGTFICFADWFPNRSKLKEQVENEVNEESIRAYLNPNKKNSKAVQIANVIVCILLVIFMVAEAKIAIEKESKIIEQLSVTKK